nr:hypothetical protein [uncultured Mucilaginibacter sp.]
MMKKLSVLFAFIVLALAACKDDKASEKVLLDEVIRIHDDVMGKEEYLMRNKMKLDTLLMPGSLNDKYTIEEKAAISAVRFKLTKADEAMSKWMEGFDPELKGKSHEEKIKYYTEQKKAVTRIDSIFTAVIEGSDKYLKKIKK